MRGSDKEQAAGIRYDTMEAAATAAENNFVVDDLLALLYDDNDVEGGGEVAAGDGEVPPWLQPCSTVDSAHGVREEGGHGIFFPAMRRNASD
jgi:hypothetical protein